MREFLIEGNKHIQSRSLTYNIILVCNGITYILLYKSTFAASADAWEEIGTYLDPYLDKGHYFLAETLPDRIIELKKWIDEVIDNPPENLQQA